VFAEDGELNISLAKIRVGETWLAAIHGHETLDAVEQQTEQKNAMLERFQREVQNCMLTQLDLLIAIRNSILVKLSSRNVILTRRCSVLSRATAQNPSFDFSGAEFNGTVPDAASFMGGIDKNAMR
jgi:hypothetical protein